MRGFSLTEVTLAVGVASVALMSVVGLMPFLLNSEKENGTNTTYAALSTQVLGRIKSEIAAGATPSSVYCFSLEGESVPAGDDPRAIYQCDVALHPVANVSADPGQHCKIVEMIFSLKGTRLNRKTMHASINERL